MELVEIDLQKEIYEGRLKAQRDALTLTNALAEAKAEAAAARAAEAAAEAMEKGILVGRIQFVQKLLRREVTFEEIRVHLYVRSPLQPKPYLIPQAPPQSLYDIACYTA